MNGLEDFLDVLEQMQTLARKEGSGDIYAISLFKDWDYNMMNNAKQIACMYGYDELGFVLSRADGTGYQDILDPDSFYIKALRFFNEANAWGLTWELGEDGEPVLTEFGNRALPNNQEPVPEEYGGGTWGNGVSALNFRTFSLQETDPNTGAPYDYLRWESTIEANRTALDEDWSDRMGADTAMEYLEQHGMILTAPGANYSTPAEDANITTMRERCKSTVIDTSWNMIFAPADAFDRLLKEMQDIAAGLGYEEVYAADLKNAKDQTAARKAAAEKYPGEVSIGRIGEK